jgi:hypothetical protein
MKRWFLTVDWCNKGRRGIFARRDGNSFGKDTQHSMDEMDEILGAFALFLDPKSIELDEVGLAKYHLWYPLAEYSDEYGIVLKDRDILARISKDNVNISS